MAQRPGRTTSRSQSALTGSRPTGRGQGQPLPFSRPEDDHGPMPVRPWLVILVWRAGWCAGLVSGSPGFLGWSAAWLRSGDEGLSDCGEAGEGGGELVRPGPAGADFDPDLALAQPILAGPDDTLGHHRPGRALLATPLALSAVLRPGSCSEDRLWPARLLMLAITVLAAPGG